MRLHTGTVRTVYTESRLREKTPLSLQVDRTRVSVAVVFTYWFIIATVFTYRFAIATVVTYWFTIATVFTYCYCHCLYLLLLPLSLLITFATVFSVGRSNDWEIRPRTSSLSASLFSGRGGGGWGGLFLLQRQSWKCVTEITCQHTLIGAMCACVYVCVCVCVCAVSYTHLTLPTRSTV